MFGVQSCGIHLSGSQLVCHVFYTCFCWGSLKMCQPVRCFGTLVFQPRKVALCCVVHSAGASPRATQALQLRGHVFCTCTGALAIRRAIQYKPPDQCSCCHNMHAWLLEQPCPSVRKEVRYDVCLAALTAMFRSRGLILSTLARSGLEPLASDLYLLS
jgi:hypothetical protein